MKKNAAGGYLILATLSVAIRVYICRPSHEGMVDTEDFKQTKKRQQQSPSIAKSTSFSSVRLQNDPRIPVQSTNESSKSSPSLAENDPSGDLELGRSESSPGSFHSMFDVPKDWLSKQSIFIHEAVKKRDFTFDVNGVMGVVDEKGKFVSWPNAPRELKRF